MFRSLFPRSVTPLTRPDAQRGAPEGTRMPSNHKPAGPEFAGYRLANAL